MRYTVTGVILGCSEGHNTEGHPLVGLAAGWPSPLGWVGGKENSNAGSRAGIAGCAWQG
jgi:hypothetical protein